MSNRWESWFLTTGMRVWTLRIPAVLVVASTALAGCSSTTENLFNMLTWTECGMTVACPEMWGDQSGWLLSQELACADWLVRSGKPGVLLARKDLSEGAFYQTQYLIILRGDGTAVRQHRERHCDGDFPPCPPGDVPWETPTVQQQCNVVVIPSDPFTCGPSGSCGRWPWGDLVNCTPIDPELSCNDAKAILAQ